MANIDYVQSRYDSDAYALEQEVLGFELPVEIVDEAANGPAQVDLRVIEQNNVMSRLMNSHEFKVSQSVGGFIYNKYAAPEAGNKAAAQADLDALYEAGLSRVLLTDYDASFRLFSAPDADPLRMILRLKGLVARQIGVRPNSMVLGTGAFEALMTQASVLDRIKYTTEASVDTALLARYFGLTRGLVVSDGRYLATDGTLQPVFPEYGMLLFYAPGEAASGVMPTSGVTRANPSFAYTYQLDGTPFASPEYLVRERRVVRAETTIERSIELVGLGATGKIGSGLFVGRVA